MRRWLGRKWISWSIGLAMLTGCPVYFALSYSSAKPASLKPDQNLEHMLGQMTPGAHISGSAFAIGHNLVVTNAHVTMRCRAANLPITVAGTDGWQIRREDAAEELSLLAGPANVFLPPLSLSAAPQLPRATPVMLLGYPYLAGSFDRLQATPGKVDRAALTVHRPDAGKSISFVTAAPDGQDVEPSWADGIAYFGAENADKLRWIVEITAAAEHGDSGGPVLDGNGNVVGVTFAGSSETNEASAVTLDDLRAFLSHSGITPDFAPPANQISPNWQRVIDRAALSVVRVGC